MARWLGGVLVLAAVATVQAAPFAWIAHDGSSWVSRIDLATHEALLVPVGTSPDAVAGTRDGLRAYVANALDGTVTISTRRARARSRPSRSAAIPPASR